MSAEDLRVHAWLSRRPAPWWVLILKGPEVTGSGRSLGRARAALAEAAYEWANDTLEFSSGEELSLAQLIVARHQAGDLSEVLMPRPESVFRADDLPRAA